MGMWGISFPDSLTKTLKSIGGAALAAPGAVYDMAAYVVPGNQPGTTADDNGGSVGSLLDAIAGRSGQLVDPLTNSQTWSGYGLGKTMEGLSWTYKEGIDRPISTAMIQAQHSGLATVVNPLKDPRDWFKSSTYDQLGDLFSGDDWAKAYGISKNQSIGQTYLTNYDPFGIYTSVGLTHHKDIDPLNVDPSKGTPFQQGQFYKSNPILATVAGIGTDTFVSWYMDPGVLSGKAFAAARAHGLGALSNADRLSLGDKLSGDLKMDGRDWAGRWGDYFNFIQGENKMQRPLSGPEIHAITPELQRSAKGQAIAGLLGDAITLPDATDRANAARRIIAAASGDVSQIDRLRSEINGTQDIADALKNIQNQTTIQAIPQALYKEATSNPTLHAALNQQIRNEDGLGNVTDFVQKWSDETKAKLSAQEDLHNSLNNLTGSLDHLPGTHTLSGARLSKVHGNSPLDKVAAEHDELLDRVKRLGERESYSSVFQKSLYHVPYVVVQPIGWAAAPLTKGVRATVRSLEQTHFSGVVNLHDWEGGIDQLNSMMRIAHVDDAARIGELQRAQTARTESDRIRAIGRVEHLSMKSLSANLSKRFGVEIDDDLIKKAMLDGQGGRQRTLATMEGGRIYSATTGDNGLRIDQFTDDGVPFALPVLTSQLGNQVPLFDMPRAVKMGTNAGYVKRLGEFSAQHKDAAYDLNGLKGALARAYYVGDKSVIGRLQKAIPFAQQRVDDTVDAANAFSRWWKMSVLFRLGYPMRVVTDDHMRIGAKIGYAPFMAQNLPEASSNIAYNIFGRRVGAHTAFKRLRGDRDLLRTLLGRNGVGRSDFTDEDYAELQQNVRIALSKKSSPEDVAAAMDRARELDPDGYTIEYHDLMNQVSSSARSMAGRKAHLSKLRNAQAPAADIAKAEASLAKFQGIHSQLLASVEGLNDPADMRKSLSEIDRIFEHGSKSYREKAFPKKAVGDAPVDLGDGTTAEGAFGPSAVGYRVATASNATHDTVWGAGEEYAHSMISAGDHRVIPAMTNSMETPGHTHVWANVLNHQFAHSPEAMAFVKGIVNTPEEFAAWVKQPENRHLIDRMEQYSKNPEDWGGRVQAMVHDYLPTKTAREALAKGRVTPRQLEKMFPDPAARPDVHGRLMDVQTGRLPGSRYMSQAVQNMFRYLSDVPTDTLSRQPFFNAVYKTEVKQAYQLRVTERGGRGGFGPDDMRQIEHVARQKALGALKNTLWDVSAHSDMANTMRFLSPFFAAHQEALNRWWNIARDDPSVVRRFQLAFDVPRRAGLTYNPDTGEVQQGASIGSGNRIMLRLPGNPNSGLNKWIKRMGGDQNWSISENGLNLIVQNGIANPGVGPFVSIPMEALVQQYADKPRLLAAARVLNQYPPNATGKNLLDRTKNIALQELEPAWARNATALIQGDGQTYSKVWSQNVADGIIAFEQAHGGRVPNDAETDAIFEAAGHHTNVNLMFMTLSNLAGFTPMKPNSKYAVVQQGISRLQDQMRQQGEDFDWLTEQIKDRYGAMYLPMIGSLISNPARLQQTPGEVSAMKDHRGLLNKIDPTLTRMVIGPEAAMDADADPAMGRYSDAARNYLAGQDVNPNSDETYVGSKSREEVGLRILIGQGWDQYDQMIDYLNVQAEQQGLASYEDSKELSAMKTNGVAYLKTQNSAWRNAYDAYSAGSYDKKLDDMRQIASNKKLLNDPMRSDVEWLGQYLAMRDQFTQMLAERAANGGAKTMNAKSNADLAQAFRNGITYIKTQSPYFAQFMYEGNIEFDPYLQSTEDDGQ